MTDKIALQLAQGVMKYLTDDISIAVKEKKAMYNGKEHIKVEVIIAPKMPNGIEVINSKIITNSALDESNVELQRMILDTLVSSLIKNIAFVEWNSIVLTD